MTTTTGLPSGVAVSVLPLVSRRRARLWPQPPPPAHPLVHLTVATVVAILVSATAASRGIGGELQVVADFEGGSAKVESLDQEKRLVRIVPTPHADRGWRCWWYFKLVGVSPEETITLDVGEAPWATPDRAAYSLDGRNWQQTDPGKREGKRIVYQQKIDAAEVWFAWGPPFVPSDAAALCKQAAQRCRFAQHFQLCRSREGRPTPALRIFEPENGRAARYGVVVVARQHAWESGSSWVCRGLIEWLISQQPQAAALRKQAEMVVVPLMDVDNAAIGAGGKEQKPHDHNRDWTEQPYFPAVEAVQKIIRQMDSAGRLDLFIDLHNPAANDPTFFFVTPRNLLSDIGQRNLERFVAAAMAEITGPLPLSQKTRESGPGYDRRWQAISKNWVTQNTQKHVVAVTLETAWNTPHSTIDGYLTVGRQLGKAIHRYLRDDPRQR